MNGIILTNIKNQYQNCKKIYEQVNKACNNFKKINTNFKLNLMTLRFIFNLNIFVFNRFIN